MEHNDVYVLGVKVKPITSDALLRAVEEILDNGSRDVILPINAHFVNIAYEESWLKEFTNNLTYVVCDGRGLMLAARILGQSIPEQIRFVDWVQLLFALLAAKGRSIYFLGASEQTIQRAVSNIKKQYPQLRIAGVHHGYFHTSEAEKEQVIREINQSATDVLLTGFSMPIEEQWLASTKEKLNVKLILLGAGCFEFLSGMTPNCPKILTSLNLEWLFRLFTEPKRLFKRYVFGNPKFLTRVLLQRLRNGAK